jgi:hypothetical protein
MLLETLTVVSAITFGKAFRPETEIDSWIGKPSSVALSSLNCSISEQTSFSIISNVTPTCISITDVVNTQSKLSFLKTELKSYTALTDGWDGVGSKKPSADQLAFALKLIDTLPASVPLPKPMLSSNGEIGFYWKNKKLLADIAIENNSSFSFFARSLLSQQEVFVDFISLESAAEKIGAAYNSI